MSNSYDLTLEELQTLYKFLEREFLDTYIKGLQEVVDKIQRIVEVNHDSKRSGATQEND